MSTEGQVGGEGRRMSEHAVLTIDVYGQRQKCSTCSEPCTGARGLRECNRCWKLYCSAEPDCVHTHESCTRVPPPPRRAEELRRPW
jgi:hypothetical protein